MARRFLTPLRLLARSTNPASGVTGDAYYNSSDNKLYVYNGSDWTLAAAQGTQGTQGTIGSQGTQGSFGTQGSQGTQGNVGAQGVQGTLGSGLWTTSSTAPVSPSVGDRWFDTDTGFEYTYIYDGNSYQWVDTRTSGYFGPQGTQGTTGTGTQGTQGTQGVQGIQGTTGTGTQGTQGTQGVQGTTGAGTQGTQGTVGSQGAAGGVTLVQYTTNQSVTNSTTKTALVSYSLTQTTSNAAYRVRAAGTYLNSSGSNRTLAVEVTLGATSAFTATTGNLASNASTRSFELEVIVFCNTSTSQTISARASLGATVGAAAWATANNQYLGTASTTEDTSTAKTLAVNFTHSFAATTITMTLNSITIEKIA